jgi:hypothetical protein
LIHSDHLPYLYYPDLTISEQTGNSPLVTIRSSDLHWGIAVTGTFESLTHPDQAIPQALKCSTGDRIIILFRIAGQLVLFN